MLPAATSNQAKLLNYSTVGGKEVQPFT